MICALMGLLLAAPQVFAEELDLPLNETVRILERWTSAHWGRDCFVWVVRYPEELAGPWVDAEAQKTGMTEETRSAYLEKFISDLELDRSETFLVSLYSYGPQPIRLAPASDNITLLTSSGERVPPTRYDSRLDASAGGVVQGLVFFPKQPDEDFSLAIRGLGVHEEQLFSFRGGQQPLSLGAARAEAEPEVVIVDLPRRPAKNEKKDSETRAQGRSQRRKVEPAPEVPPPPPVPREVPPLLVEDSSDMAAFVQSVRERGAPKPANSPEQGKKKEKEKEKKKSGTPAAPVKPQNTGDAYVSREHVLRQFLGMWAGNRAEEMYDMLSEGSKKVISRQNFAKEVAKASDFRAALKGEYRIDWIGEERARVITTRRVLMFRSLITRTLGVVREGSSWKVVW
ncbi:MAG: hypothetical protein K6E38_00750 [Fretibacterium sp.]|nr:hypothetical protein [Fretibacterium sp.]